MYREGRKKVSLSLNFFICSCREKVEKKKAVEVLMGWFGIALLLVCLQATPLLLPPRTVAGDFLSPLLSPVIDRICDVVQCGKGSCKASLDHSFGFVCECDAGWSQFHIEDHLRFLPCVIPNCSLNYSCSNEPMPVAYAPAPSPPSNLSIFDPCKWSYCGGGSCTKMSTFGHRCDCKEGFDNLLNVTRLPCFKDCSIGADCSKLGISLPNASTSVSSPSNSSSIRDHLDRMKLMWLLFVVVSFMVAGPK